MRVSLASISVSGFKSIAEEQAIEVRPLTILAGANSSGKSSIMQPLLLMKQTILAPFDPGGLLLSGPNLSVRSGLEIMALGRAIRRRDWFQIRLELTDQSRMDLMFGDLYESQITVKMSSFQPVEKPEGAVLKYHRCLPVHVVEGSEGEGLFYQPKPARHTASLLGRMIHLPGLRGRLDGLYGTAGVSGTIEGTFEHYVGRLVNQWQEGDSQRLRSLGLALEFIGLARSVEAKMSGDEIELFVSRRLSGEGDVVPLRNVGLGVSQVLPILVALLHSEEGDVLYIEQPELHLHPLAQIRLTKLIADAANRGVRIVAETHSSLMLREVQTMIAQGDLSPEIVRLHWFQRDPGSGETAVTTAELDGNGAFGDWPEDFDAIAIDSEKRYLDAVEARSKYS